MEVQNINDHMLPIIILGSGGAFLLSASVILFFFRYQKRTQQQKEQLLQTELVFRQQLLHANIKAQEEERVRISKELHDHVGSTLSTLRFLVNRFDGATPGTAALSDLTTEYKEMIDGVITDVRNISHSLAPPGLAIFGLYETLQTLCEKTSRSAGMNITVNREGHVNPDILPFDDALAVYRVVQELIANTLKHARATSVTINISGDNNNVHFVYSDDGIGCDASVYQATGIGIRNMESRLKMIGANHKLETSPGKGFTFTIDIPAGHIIKPQLNG